MVAIQVRPMLSTDEWDRYGRPFWVIRTERQASDPGDRYGYATTLVPMTMTLQAVVVTPVGCDEITAGGTFGTGPLFGPVEWEDVRELGPTVGRIKRGIVLGPRVVTPRHGLTPESVQRYALPDDPARSTPAPQIGTKPNAMPIDTIDPDATGTL
jgi:hypothetical protein